MEDNNVVELPRGINPIERVEVKPVDKDEQNKKDWEAMADCFKAYGVTRTH